MTKDPTSAEGKGTPAKKSGPALKVPLKVPLKVQSKAQPKVQVKVQVKAQHSVPSTTTAQIKEKAVALAAAAMLTLPLPVAPPPVAAQVVAGPPISPTVPTVPTVPTAPTAPTAPHETTTAAGQEGTLIIRMERTFTVLGVGGGHTVFKDAQGATFYIEPGTGDKQTVAADYFGTLDDGKGVRSASRIKFTNVMIVSILGVDAHGNTVMRNARNETFTLDPRTGNKALIKWPK